MLANAAPWQGIIAPSAPPAPLWPMLAWGLVGVLLLLVLLWLVRHWWRQPRRAARLRLGRIQRSIEAGAISPREGLHDAAHCLEGLSLDDGDRVRLEQRFAYQAPGPEAAVEILRRLQRSLSQ